MTLLFRRKYLSIGTQPAHNHCNLGSEKAIQMDAVGILALGLLVRDSLTAESLCCVLEQDTVNNFLWVEW